MKIAEEDRYKTTFHDALGHLWEYVRCGYGLKVPPTAFHRRFSGALFKATGLKSWLDDILVSSTLAGHLKNLRVVLECLLTAGLAVIFQKPSWCAPKQQFVRMVIDASGVRPSASRVEAIMQLAPPRNVEQL